MAKPKTTKLRRWTTEEIEFLKENFATMLHRELAEYFGRTEQAVRAKCFELNLYKKEYPWTQKELDFLLNNYKTMTYREIGKELGRTLDAVRSKAGILKLDKDPYHCDYDYFKVIDTEEKAYWLGFIFADGWTYLSKSTEAGCLGIELQKSDTEHLRKFNKSIHGNYKIVFRTRVVSEGGFALGVKDMCYIRIFSRPLTDDLISHGVVPNKSLVKKFPKTVPEHLIRHFIRGYFDGNGSICAAKNKSGKINRLDFSFCSGSKDFLDALKEQLIENEIYCSKTYTRDNEKGETTVFSFHVYSNFENAQKFYNFIYDNHSISLDRKYNLARHASKIVKNKRKSA